MPLSVAGLTYATNLTTAVATSAGASDFGNEEGAALIASVMKAYMSEMLFPTTTSAQHDAAEQAMIDSLVPDGGTPFNEEPTIAAQLDRLELAHQEYVNSIHAATVGPGVGQSFSAPLPILDLSSFLNKSPPFTPAADIAQWALFIDTWVRGGFYVVSTGPTVTGPWS